MTPSRAAVTIPLVVAIACVAVAIGCAKTISAMRLIDHVDTRIGSGGFGFGIGEVPVGASVPFGALRSSAVTSLGYEALKFQLPFAAYGGYWRGDAHDVDVPILAPLVQDLLQPRFITGLVHTAPDGTGGADWLNFLVAPVRHGAGDDLGKLIVAAGYKSTFNHSSETAKPGYYRVRFDTPDAVAETTASGEFSAMHRFTCNGSNARNCALLFDLCHAAPNGVIQDYNANCVLAQLHEVTRSADGRTVTVTASMTMHGALTGRSLLNDGVRVYFHAVVSVGTSPVPTSFASEHAWINQSIAASVADVVAAGPTRSRSLGCIFTANTTAAVFTVRAGISFVSTQLARANLAAQQPQGNATVFEDVVVACQAKWERLLSRVQIPAALTANYSQPVGVFYTGLYHEFIAPTRMSESDGSFLGLDGQVHRNDHKSVRRVSELSLWDGYRSYFSFLTLAAPAAVYDTVTSMMRMTLKEFPQPPYNDPLRLPQWIMANVEADSMSGKHSASVMLRACHQNVSRLAGSSRPGALALDCEQVYRVVSTAIIAFCRRNMGGGGAAGSGTQYFYQANNVGNTLEYAVTAAAVLVEARRRNDSAVIAALEPYAVTALRQSWNSTRRLFCARAPLLGAFDCPAIDWIPYPFNSDSTTYIEGSAVDYRWYAPGSLDMLFELMGGRAATAASLERFFQNTFNWFLKNTTLLNPYEAVSNEPTLLVPALFAALGPEYAHRSQYWVRRITDWRFFFGPAGIPGNDDVGETTSWMLFSYIGFYPMVAASTTGFTIHSAPRFDRVSFNLPTPPAADTDDLGPGLQLTILARNRTGGDSAYQYVRSVSINGVPLQNPWFEWDDFYRGPLHTPGSNAAVMEYVLTTEPVRFGAGNGGHAGAVWVPPLPQRPEEISAQERVHMETILAAVKKRQEQMLAKRLKPHQQRLRRWARNK